MERGETIESVMTILMTVTKMLADVVGALSEERTRNDRTVTDPIEPLDPVVKPREAAKLLGVSVKAVEYRARQGHIRRAMPNGAKRGFGYIRKDILALVNGRKAT